LEYQWSIRESLRMRVENPIQFIDGAGRKGGFGYDPMSRPIAVTDGSGHTRKEGDMTPSTEPYTRTGSVGNRPNML
jgi:hypothetical protein